MQWMNANSFLTYPVLYCFLSCSYLCLCISALYEPGPAVEINLGRFFTSSKCAGKLWLWSNVWHSQAPPPLQEVEDFSLNGWDLHSYPSFSQLGNQEVLELYNWPHLACSSFKLSEQMQDVNVDRFGVCISHSYLHLVRRILNLKCNDVLHLKWFNKNAKDPHIAATVASKQMVSSSDIVDSASKCLGSKPQEKNFPVDLPTESPIALYTHKVWNMFILLMVTRNPANTSWSW